MTIRLATWNVNGVRARLDSVARFVQEWRPHVLCLQETKVDDPLFPAAALRDLGYVHQALHGQRGRHGVATLSRLPFRAVERLTWCGREEARHISVTFSRKFELHNFYVPKGGHEPNPNTNLSFAYKLAFLSEVGRWFTRHRRPDAPLMLVGDLNVAPLETDVWNHKRLRRSVGHTPMEVDRLEEARASLDWTDAERLYVPPEQPLYTWWGYRVPNAFEKGYGWRLDHVWVTAPLLSRLSGVEVVSDVRTWTRPSDHVPVVADLSIAS